MAYAFCVRALPARSSGSTGKRGSASPPSALGEALYRRHGLRTDVYETNLVIIDGIAYTRMDGFIAVLDALGWRRTAKMLHMLPRRMRDALYGLIARNRYALFGKRDTCDIPSPALRSRLIG